MGRVDALRPSNRLYFNPVDCVVTSRFTRARAVAVASIDVTSSDRESRQAISWTRWRITALLTLPTVSGPESMIPSDSGRTRLSKDSTEGGYV